MKIENTPKISCLCVTNNRVVFLRNAITCFMDQTYKNKELVIVYLSNDSATADFLHDFDNRDVVISSIDSCNLTLGDLRNIAIEKSSGQYICNWDDDDWYHPERLEFQFKEMYRNGKRASILNYILMYDRCSKAAYITSRRNWENSFLCEKAFLCEHSISYPSLNKGEDTPFVERLISAGVLYPIIRPELYIYCYTGLNTCGNDHFRLLFSFAECLSNDASKIIEDILLQNISNLKAREILNSQQFLSMLIYD